MEDQIGQNMQSTMMNTGEYLRCLRDLCDLTETNDSKGCHCCFQTGWKCETPEPYSKWQQTSPLGEDRATDKPSDPYIAETTKIELPNGVDVTLSDVDWIDEWQRGQKKDAQDRAEFSAKNYFRQSSCARHDHRTLVTISADTMNGKSFDYKIKGSLTNYRRTLM